MTTSITDPQHIRQYLLGRLDHHEELENSLSEAILFQKEISEIADLIEDEIIEQYLDGTLDAADRNDVENYFLRPAERREKLQFARLLRDRFGSSLADMPLNKSVSPLPGMDVPQSGAILAQGIHRYSFLRTYGQLTALVLLCTMSGIYISSLQKKQGRLEATLAQERDRVATLDKQSQLLQSRTSPLYLVPDATRAPGGPTPYIEMKPSTELALVDIALPGGVSGPIYDVVLQKAGATEPIWAAKLPCIVSTSGDARLVFDLPVQGLESGRYSLLVSSTLPGSAHPEHYEFEARVTK